MAAVDLVVEGCSRFEVGLASLALQSHRDRRAQVPIEQLLLQRIEALVEFRAVLRHVVAVSLLLCATFDVLFVVNLDVNAAKVVFNGHALGQLPVFVVQLYLRQNHHLLLHHIERHRVHRGKHCRVKGMHEGRVEEILGESDAYQIEEQDQGDESAGCPVDRGKLLLLVVGQGHRVRVQVELLDAALGLLAGPARVMGLSFSVHDATV